MANNSLGDILELLAFGILGKKSKDKTSGSDSTKK